MRTFPTSLLLAAPLLLLSSSVWAAEFRPLQISSDTLRSLQAAIPNAASRQSPAFARQLASLLDLEEASSLRFRSEQKLLLNQGRLLRFSQTYQGVPIWTSDIILEEDAEGRFTAVQGEALYDVSAQEATSPDPELSPTDALDRAQQGFERALESRSLRLPETTPYEHPTARLLYYLNAEGVLVLVYRVSFLTAFVANREQHVAEPVYLIDAFTGGTLETYDNSQRLAEGTGPGGNTKIGAYSFGSDGVPTFPVVQDGDVCELDSPDLKTQNHREEPKEPGSPWQFECFENTFEHVNGAYSPLNDAHSFGRVTLDMFAEWYGVTVLDDKHHFRVHYRRFSSLPWSNASWSPSAQKFQFGDGGGSFFPFVSLDIVAHEVAHAFTEKNSGLLYRGQSGGINEAFSDMSGEVAEKYYFEKYGQDFGRPMPDFKSGADIVKAEDVQAGNLCDPPLDGKSISHKEDYVQGMDVHRTSGIYNRAFCALAKRSSWGTRRAFEVFLSANQRCWTGRTDFVNGAGCVLAAARKVGYSETDVIDSFGEVGIVLEALPPVP